MKEIKSIRLKDAAVEVKVEEGEIEALKSAKGRKEWRESARSRQEFIQSLKPKA